jgi:membrane associated rhomboid family serine protease
VFDGADLDVAAPGCGRDGRAHRLMFPVENSVPLRYPPIVTWALIAANCAVFLFEANLSEPELEQFLLRFALIPARYFEPELFGGAAAADYLPFATNMFLHGGWLHLILNMWTLWLFGRAIEDRLGPGRYIAFYLACGVLASATHAVFNPISTVPALGASGAIAGVLGCYMRMFPLARVVVLVPILFFPFFFEVPGIVFAGLWLLLQVLQGTAELFSPSVGGGVAWWAHVGGFVGGFLLTPLLRRSRRRYRTYYADEGILGFDPRGRR